MVVIVDAKNMILGRMASKVAKMALLGESVVVINCEKAYVGGDKELVKAKYMNAYKRGVPLRGPYISRSPERLVRRTIRGMIPYKQGKGLEAFKRIKTYTGVPESFKDEEKITFKEFEISKLPTLKYISIGEISKHLGSKFTGEQ